MTMLELRQVSKVYGQGAAGVHALREASLEVDPGMMVAVMGPSGSGKSTLLTIAGSLEEPTSGQVLAAGQDLAAAENVALPLDSASAEAVMRMIHTACQRGIAAVVVTPDAQLASWADRVMFIRDGRIVDQTVPAPGPDSLLGQDR
jgi:ABC-type lipoprotein export system ATPase subunit